MADKTVKPNHVIDTNPRNVKEIIISLEKREEILTKLGQVFKKWNTIKCLSYWAIQLYWKLGQKINWSKWFIRVSIFC